jgi:sugar lactone lactonase YvrE
MTDTRIIKRSAVVPVHEANALTGEVPSWDARSGTLWWADIQGQRLLGFSPTTGRQESHNVPSMLGLIVLRASGGLVLGLEDGLYPFDAENGLGKRLAAVEADDARTRVNDGTADPAGRLWFGTMDKTGSGEPIGSLYCLEVDGSVRRVRSNVRVPNAISFSPDGRTFYWADSRTRVLETCDYDPATGELGSLRIFAQYPHGETPDGACVDAEGALWIAVVGGARLERRLPDGTLDTVVELPVSRPTMPRLGGPDGRTLFVTSQRRFLDAERLAREPLAGDLLMIRADFVGGSTPRLAAI